MVFIHVSFLLLSCSRRNALASGLLIPIQHHSNLCLSSKALLQSNFPRILRFMSSSFGKFFVTFRLRPAPYFAVVCAISGSSGLLTHRFGLLRAAKGTCSYQFVLRPGGWFFPADVGLLHRFPKLGAVV